MTYLCETKGVKIISFKTLKNKYHDNANNEERRK